MFSRALRSSDRRACLRVSRWQHEHRRDGRMKRWEFSHGRVGVNAPSWLTYEVHRPYLEAAEDRLTVLQAKGGILAARRFEQRSPDRLRFGMTMPASYRQLLTDESRLAAYRVTNPAELPDHLASPAWQQMAQAYLKRSDLDAVDRAGLAQWLVAGCLPRAVLDVVSDGLRSRVCGRPIPAVTHG